MAPTDQYLETQVPTAPPEQLHMLVIDAALRFARLGSQSLGEQDYEIAHESLSRSREFVNELINGLKPDGNEELAENLQRLFGFVYRSLVDADANHDQQKANDAIKILEQHRDTWMELMGKLAQEHPAPAAQPHQSMVSEHDETTRSWLT